MDGFSLETGSGGIGVEPVFVAPGSLGDTGASDSGTDTGTRSRRTRSDAGQPRAGRGTNKRKVKSSVSVDALSRTLMVFTATLAGLSKIPEIAFDSEDANSGATALNDFLEQFDVQVDPKIQAAVNLALVFGTITSAKVYLYKERLKVENMRNVTDQ